MKQDASTRDQTAAGRPRDPRIDHAVLRATAELVAEVGYADLTIAAIAARAGTTKPAIYRRWPSKAHVVHEAVFADDVALSLPDTGSVEGDVRAMLRGALAAFSDPLAAAALPGLFAEVAADPSLHEALLARFRVGVWEGLRERLRAGAAAGDVRGDADPDVLLETIAGATLMALLLRPADRLDDAWVERTADLLTKGLLP